MRQMKRANNDLNDGATGFNNGIEKGVEKGVKNQKCATLRQRTEELPWNKSTYCYPLLRRH